MIHACGLAVAVHITGLRTSEHFMCLGKVLKKFRGGPTPESCLGRNGQNHTSRLIE